MQWPDGLPWRRARRVRFATRAHQIDGEQGLSAAKDVALAHSMSRVEKESGSPNNLPARPLTTDDALIG